MLDLGVGATQGCRGVGSSECSGHQRNEECLLRLLMRQQLGLQLRQQPLHRRQVAAGAGQRVSHRADPLDGGQNRVVLCTQGAGRRLVLRRHGDGVCSTGQHRTQGEADRQYVNDLLRHRTCRRLQKPESRGDHGRQREPHADHDRLQRDGLGAPGDQDRLRQGVNPVDGQHDVSGLRRRRRTPCGQRDAGSGCRQRGRIVDAVTDHDGGARRGLTPDRGELVGGVAVRQNLVDADDAPDGLGTVCPVTGQQDNAPDACRPQSADHARRLGPDGVFQQQRARRLVVDSSEDDERAIKLRAPSNLKHPEWGILTHDPGRFAQPHAVTPH